MLGSQTCRQSDRHASRQSSMQEEGQVALVSINRQIDRQGM